MRSTTHLQLFVRRRGIRLTERKPLMDDFRDQRSVDRNFIPLESFRVILSAWDLGLCECPGKQMSIHINKLPVRCDREDKEHT